ncbi:MAG: AI-2E family transporter [Treponema sp.]|nr:AI-2E family transporter [Treponema sp.]
MEDNDNYWVKATFFILLFLGVIVGFAILKLLSSVLQPIGVAVLLAFLFFPIVTKMSKKLHIPFILGVIIVYILFFGVFFAISNILLASVKSIIASLPQYQERFSDIYEKISSSIMNTESKYLTFFQFDKNQSFFENVQGLFNFFPTMKKFAVGFTGFLYSFLKSLFIVILFSLFLLAEMNLTNRKIALALSRKNRMRMERIMIKIVSEVTRYISIKFIVSVLTGIFVFLAALVVGMDFPLVWGFIAFIMNFIPTFGSIISWGVTVLFSLIQFYPSPFPIVFITLSVLLVNMLIGNVLEPKIEGENLGISPFVILVSLSLWGWLWGFVGLILSVPLTVIVKIVCENISFLHPIAIFIGSKRSTSH